MKLTDHKILCDNPGCDYSENVMPSIMPSLVDKPCPKCGANLLTDDDLDSHLKLLAAASKYADDGDSKSIKKYIISARGGKVTIYRNPEQIKQLIEQGIREHLVIENKAGIKYAVEKIYKLLNDKP